MSTLHMLRALVDQRLTAAVDEIFVVLERTIAQYQAELSTTKEEHNQLMDAVFKKHQVVLHRTDVQQPPHIKEEEEDPQPTHMKEEEEDPQPTHMKEEEDPHMKEEEEGECVVGQEEDDVSKFPLTVVSVKTEEHEDKAPESSQLHHSPNVQQPLHIKEEEEDPQPNHIKKEEEDPQPTHIKEEEGDPQPTHIKEEEDDPQPTNIKEEDEDPQPTHIKEEEEDPQPPHMKEEGECVVGQEEDDVSKFPLTVVSVKTEEHEDKAPESSQLHHSPNVQQPLHIKEEEEDPQPNHIKKEEEDPQPTHIKEEEDDPQPTNIKEEDEDPQPTHIKEEEEDPQPPHMKEEGECVVGQEEDDVMTVVSVKTEEHEDKARESSQLHHSPNVQRVSAGSHEEEWHTSVGQKELQAPSHIKEEQLHDEDEAQSLQLHHSQSEENRGAELVSQHITEADGEHCEDIKSEPDSIFAPLSDMDHMMSHSSDHSDHIQKPLESQNDSKARPMSSIVTGSLWAP
ncbi:cardiomyopathy-associated protein 5-like isoform X10 [Entelurus aequoreus]|uniref:cardiomyopathy-associated protein 5-like isoform X10 n=1 Tax=Entelurus aequoreus TaxID=161455 RepID=UPI002B1DEBB3|nr:cardiomyopathy-associated protein 5-like isoform X10 [Entelurus aequoreus]